VVLVRNRKSCTIIVAGSYVTLALSANMRRNNRMTKTMNKFWTGPVPDKDDFGDPIKNVFVDGKTNRGPWAIMSAVSWRIYGIGAYGTGLGQRYVKTAEGRWMKTEG
jgi:hypothetical protein